MGVAGLVVKSGETLEHSEKWLSMRSVVDKAGGKPRE